MTKRIETIDMNDLTNVTGGLFGWAHAKSAMPAPASKRSPATVVTPPVPPKAPSFLPQGYGPNHPLPTQLAPIGFSMYS